MEPVLQSPSLPARDGDFITILDKRGHTTLSKVFLTSKDGVLSEVWGEGVLERLLSHSLQWQRDGIICRRMSVLTKGQADMEDQSLGLVEEEMMTDVYRALCCQDLSVQCYQPLSTELRGTTAEGGETVPDTQAPASTIRDFGSVMEEVLS